VDLGFLFPGRCPTRTCGVRHKQTHTRTHAPTPTRKKKGTHAHLIFETPSHTFFLSFFFERRTPQISSSPASPVFSAQNLIEQIPISANAARRGFPSARPTTDRPASRLLYRRNAGGPADPPTAATHFGRVPCRQRFGLSGTGAWNGRRQNHLTRAICADYAERCRAALPALRTAVAPTASVQPPVRLASRSKAAQRQPCRELCSWFESNSTALLPMKII